LTAPQPEDAQAAASNWLLKYLTVQQLYDTKIVSMLQRAQYDAGVAADKWNRTNIGDRTKRYQFNLVKDEIRTIIKTMFKDLVPVINAGQQDAAEAAAKAALAQDAQVLDVLFPNDKAREAWEQSFILSARHGIQAAIFRITKTKLPLSSQVYRTSAMESGRLDRKINSALARGASAKELADLVRNDIKPSVPGGVSYAAMRLGRSEINNAFHAMSVDQAQEDPWVEQMEWHLSKVHKPDPGDLCEKYADTQYFPKDEVPPKPHPQCMCYVTRKEMSWDNFTSALESGKFDDFFEKKYGMPAA